MNENVKFVDVDGQQVALMTPDYDRPLAIVDMNVLKKLANLLPKANAKDIIDELKYTLDGVYKLETAVQVAEEFVAFHKTVNLISEYKMEPTVVGHTDLENKNNY